MCKIRGAQQTIEPEKRLDKSKRNETKRDEKANFFGLWHGLRIKWVCVQKDRN